MSEAKQLLESWLARRFGEYGEQPFANRFEMAGADFAEQATVEFVALAGRERRCGGGHQPELAAGFKLVEPDQP